MPTNNINSTINFQWEAEIIDLTANTSIPVFLWEPEIIDQTEGTLSVLDGDDMDAESPTEPGFDSAIGYFESEPDDDGMSKAESLTELDFDSMLGYCESEFNDVHTSLDSELELDDDALPTYTAKSDDEHKAIKSEPASGVIDLATKSSTGSPDPFRLLDLLDRVRLQVYGYIMTTPKDVILRLPSEMRNIQRSGNPPVNIFPGTAILYTRFLMVQTVQFKTQTAPTTRF